MNQTNLHKQNSGTVKIHELTGFITGKEPYKVYHKDSPYHGNLCYKLSIVLENNSQQSNGKTAKLFIYPNLVRPEIYQAIEQTQYIDKHYHLFCEKKKKGWILHNWKPLTNHEKK